MTRWFGWERHKKDLYEELAAHLRLDIEERIARGEHPDEARAAAVREMGNIPLIEDVTRKTWGWERLELLAHDVKFSLRQLRRSPAFTIPRSEPWRLNRRRRRRVQHHGALVPPTRCRCHMWRVFMEPTTATDQAITDEME